MDVEMGDFLGGESDSGEDEDEEDEENDSPENQFNSYMVDPEV
jgi:hypothetical protein